MRFTVLVFMFLLFSCGSTEIDSYINSLPENESINASIANYENILAEVHALILKEDYKGVTSKVISFFEVFKEDDRCEISLAFSQVLPMILQDREITEGLMRLNDQFLDLLHLKREKGELKLNQDLWISFLKKRPNYWIELIAYDLSIEQGRREGKLNVIKILENTARRFPHSKKYKEILSDSEFTQGTMRLLDKKKVSSYLEMIELSQVRENCKILAMPKGDHVIVRNKRNHLYSRELHRLRPWEEFRVLGFFTNEILFDGEETREKWVGIEYAKGKTGFIEAGQFGASRLDSYPEKKKYRLALDHFYLGRYIESAQLLTYLIQVYSEGVHDELVLFLHDCHREIAKRATSVASSYVRYVKKNPFYFSVKKEGLFLDVSFILRDRFDHDFRTLAYFKRIGH